MTKDKLTIPESFKAPVHVHIGIGCYNFNELTVKGFEFESPDNENFGVIHLKGIEVDICLSDVSIDNNEVTKRIVESLEEKKVILNAECHVALAKIQDQIDKYLAIEHTDCDGVKQGE